MLPPTTAAVYSRSRDIFLSVLEDVRKKYDFVVVGYVVMPEHVHLLVSEPEIGDPSLSMQVLKQRTSRKLNKDRLRFWQLRFYDFNVFSQWKRNEKLNYMHWNPVRRKLVESPEQWQWSSYRHYVLRERRIVTVNEGWGAVKPIV